METKQFHLGDVLSITTGRLMSPNGMSGIYEILNFMTGASLFTHQLPRASTVCAPCLLKQHPQLANTSGEGINPNNCEAILKELVETHGEQLAVEPLPEGAYEALDPVEELASSLQPYQRILVVKSE